MSYDDWVTENPFDRYEQDIAEGACDICGEIGGHARGCLDEVEIRQRRGPICERFRPKRSIWELNLALSVASVIMVNVLIWWDDLLLFFFN